MLRVSVLALTVSTLAFAQSADTTIKLEVPAGWTYDEASSKEKNLYILVPTGKAWSETPMAIYSKVTPVAAGGPKSVREFAEARIAARVAKPEIKAKRLLVIRTGNGKALLGASFENSETHRVEEVRYCKVGEKFVTLSVFGEDANAFKTAKAAFDEVLKKLRL